MLSIDKLWQRRVEEVMGIVAAGETSHRELAIVSEYVEADYHGRFLAELLQNANDQAVKSSIGETSVSIVRTKDCIGVANRGDPFDQDGIRSITSIGLSPKDPAVLIGNKGVGFKSVFQVCHSPEIYSAPGLGDNFLSEAAVRFRLSLTPFHGEKQKTILASIVDAAVSNSPELAKKISLGGFETIHQHLISEVGGAAPFKFPIQIDKNLAKRRYEELSGIDGSSETLVALPLRDGEDTQEIVADALGELLESYGASILFLPGISQIKIVDYVQGTETLICRRSIESRNTSEPRESIKDIETEVRQGKTVASRANWRVISGLAGAGGSESADRLNDAAQELPGASFEDVRQCPVSVALPIPEIGPHDKELQLSNGKLCIGLPTHDVTGTPAWLHSHFYGNISRKDIDLDTCKFNQILFEEAIRLHELLLIDLRNDEDESFRRAATLAYYNTAGPLADALHNGFDLADQEIILGENGKDFIAPVDVILPEPQEYGLVKKLLEASPNAGSANWLPEMVLATLAHFVLSDICDYYSDDEKLRSLFLERHANGRSTLEIAAKTYREEGPTFWIPFVTWMLATFDENSVVDQKVLPIGQGGVCSAAERVFILPMPRSKDDSDDDDEEGAEDLESLPSDVRASLRFLDESAIPVRTGKGRALTDIAAQLAPQGGGLVRRPRLDQLINDAIEPAMSALEVSERDLRRGIALLELAVKWMSRMSPRARSNIDDRALRVPVEIDREQDNAEMAWVPAIDAYFGAGWIDGPAEELLNAAYGHRQETILISWSNFETLAPETLRNRGYWRKVMADIGVSHAPKLIIHSDRRRRPPLTAWSRDCLNVVENPMSPIKPAREYWPHYLAGAAQRPAGTRSGQPYNFHEVAWLDGLERPESRGAVMTLVLANPDEYERHLSTRLSRADMRNQDGSDIESLWVHAIRSNDWAILPTNKGWRRPSESWLLVPGQTGKARRRLDTLTFVDHIYRRAERILLAIGVAPLADPSASRIVDEIDRIARKLSGMSSGEKGKALAMVEDLFSRLQASVTDESESEAQEVPPLNGKWLPFKKGDDVIGIVADDIDSAYFVDDAERAKFVADLKESLVWPIQPRGTFRSFAAQLRQLLGDRSVVFTSGATVDTGFTPLDQAEIPLLQWIKKTFSARNVVLDLGCLIAYAGNRETDPNGDRFAKIWRKFQTANLAFGTFPNSAPSRSFFDERLDGSSQLQIDHHLNDFAALTATWRLVAKAYEDTWYRYADRLMQDSAEAFMMEKVPSLAQREEVMAVIGGSSAIFQPLKAVFFSILHEDKLDKASTSDFEEAWEKNSLATATLSAWVQGRISPETLSSINFESIEDTIVKCVEESGTTIEHWQAARKVLGEPAFTFTHSKLLWQEIMRRVMALLQATVARSPLVDLNAIQSTLFELSDRPVPQGVTENPCSAREVLGHVLSHAQHVVDAVEVSRVRELLNRRIKSLGGLEISAPHEIRLEDPPARDVQEYFGKAEVQREQDAEAHLESLIYVATRVAELIGEDADLGRVKEDGRIKQLAYGRWANAYCLVVAFQARLDELAPQTLRALSDKRAFGTKKSRNEMLALFPELDATVAVEEIVPEPVVELFGEEYSQEDMNLELSKGANGKIGQAVLGAAVSAQVTFESFEGKRGSPVTPKRMMKDRRGGRRIKVDSRSKNAMNELVGMLGEVYVYEMFRSRELTGFDDSAWKSGMRNKYMADDLGDDSLGYDIEFVDTDNILAHGGEDTRCLIEVKSTSGDGLSPFQMSVGEWERAAEAHFGSNEEYFIFRVQYVTDPDRIAIASIIPDPYGCRKRNELELVANDFWVYAGPVLEDP